MEEFFSNFFFGFKAILPSEELDSFEWLLRISRASFDALVRGSLYSEEPTTLGCDPELFLDLEDDREPCNTLLLLSRWC